MDIEKFLEKLNKKCVHAKNLLAKIKQKEKYYNVDFNTLFELYKKFYDNMQKNKNLNEKIEAFINYKMAIKNIHHPFSSQSKFEPTILEEFLYHLFKEFESGNIEVGSIKAYSNLYFSPKNLDEFKDKNFIKINSKDQDFAIYKKVLFSDEYDEEYKIYVPIVTIECKTYLDKTMLEGSIATAEKIKFGNPHCKFYIVTETYEVDYKVDPATSRIDNIFILKKGGRNKRDDKISKDVILRLYKEVKTFLNSDWSNIKDNIENYGVIFN